MVSSAGWLAPVADATLRTKDEASEGIFAPFSALLPPVVKCCAIKFEIRAKFRLLQKLLNKGPFIFYKVGVAGGIWGEGAMREKWLSRGGHPKKIRGKGGVT